MKKYIQQFILPKGAFANCWQKSCGFNAKVLSACWRYKARLFYTLYRITMSKQHLFSKLSVRYRVNVNHQQSIHHPLSTLSVWGQRIPWQLSKQISKLFFKMSAQVFSVPSQIEGRKKVFLEWTNIDLSSKLSLTCRGNVNYI